MSIVVARKNIGKKGKRGVTHTGGIKNHQAKEIISTIIVNPNTLI